MGERREAPIVEAVRTPVGHYGGALKDVRPDDLAALVVKAVVERGGRDPAKVNVNGGAIARSHPLGSTGARLATTLCHELRRRGGRYDPIAMCIGVGQGIATIVERATSDE